MKKILFSGLLLISSWANADLSINAVRIESSQLDQLTNQLTAKVTQGANSSGKPSAKGNCFTIGTPPKLEDFGSGSDYEKGCWAEVCVGGYCCYGQINTKYGISGYCYRE